MIKQYKKIAIAAILAAGTTGIKAQNTGLSVEGSSYYLPQTALRFAMQVEKTTYTPGDFAMYASRYLKRNDISMEPSTTYRIVNLKLNSIAQPDTSKFFTAKADAKHSIRSLERDDNGVLVAINAKPRKIEAPRPFVPAKKPTPINPRDFMTEEILSAGSSAKMAELCVQEIYDIRDNKGLLNKGQADFMPKDGEQLKIMLRNLDQQENALMQLFTGTTVKDTVENIITFVPTRETDKQLLFRFSKYLGMTDSDDLGGSPYYIKVEDLHSMPTLNVSDDGKKDKDNVGIYVNLPGKIRVTIYNDEHTLGSFELYAAQFGKTESISGEMFSKKYTTSIVLNPVTGSAEKIETEAIK
ncbi:MAG TPA: DUF4831 domain-containing protein [Prevotella sp.]|nr:DUF4831 domain-containing protein [Prevotella sp.]